MTEENKPKTETKKDEKKSEKKIEAKPLPVDKEKAKEIEQSMKTDSKEKKIEEKKEEKPAAKSEEKKKKDQKPKVKKEEAFARGINLPISKKHAIYICSFIKNKSIDQALSDLEKVQKLKIAVPYKGEIPHRKGNMERGRYPAKASGYFISLLKGLKGNVITNGMEIEDTKIYLASASWANRPMRRGGRSAKRTNVLLKAKEFPEKIKPKKTSPEQNSKGKVGKETDKVSLQEDNK